MFARPVGIAAHYIARWQSDDGLLHRVVGSLSFQVEEDRIEQIEGVFWQASS